MRRDCHATAMNGLGTKIINKCRLAPVILFMTKPANSTDKASPSDTPTDRPNDKGGKAKVRQADKEYDAKKPHGGDIAIKHERDEQPVNPVAKS